MSRTAAVQTCDSGKYWDDLKCAFRQPEWLSSVGIPLVLTIVGLAVAYVLVRRQINHDRTLRDADRAATAVNGFGREILRLLRYGEANRPDDPYWTEESWPGSLPLYEAQSRVMVALSDPLAFGELQRARSDLARAWRACQVRRRRLAKNGITAARSSTNGIAMSEALAPIWLAMIDAGKKLVAWDGLSAPPSLTPWPYEHAPAGKRVADGASDAWVKKYAEEFERIVRERVALGK